MVLLVSLTFAVVLQIKQGGRRIEEDAGDAKHNAVAVESTTGDTARLKNADVKPKYPFPTLSVKPPPP
jgi:hypothetical protein